MPQIVGAHAIEYPWAVARDVLDRFSPKVAVNLLVKLGHAAFAFAAMLTPQRSSYHAVHAKVLIVKLPQAKQLLYDALLLASPAGFGHESRISNHAEIIKVRAHEIDDAECGVVDKMCSPSAWKDEPWPMVDATDLLRPTTRSHLIPTQKSDAANMPEVSGYFG